MNATPTDTAAKTATNQEVELDLLITRYEQVANGVVQLTLVDPAGGEPPSWTPGAHIDLMLAPSLVRQYSLCSSVTNEAEWSIGVLRDPASRGGSKHVHSELSEGVKVHVRGPRNNFPFLAAPSYQFIAGGIGITPILPMIEAAEKQGADWHLLYGGRERASMAFVDALSAYGDKVTIWPQDEKGMLDLQSVLGTPRDDTLVYSCGPEGLLGAVEAGCAAWPEGSLHIERFAAKSVEPSDLALYTFDVECARSGVTLTIGPDESIYDVAEEAGLDVLASCMEGVCGTCEVRVLDGTPDHRDSILTPAQKKSCAAMMICVSRSCSSKLVLDI